MNNDREEIEGLEVAHRALAASREGVLRIDDNSVAVKFITAKDDGRIVASVPVATFFATELILLVPDEKEGALQLLLSAEALDEGPETDRWMAFHTESEHVRWGIFYIDAGRFEDWVFDGDAMMRPNLLGAGESALVKKMNSDKGKLVKVCQRFAGTVVPDPVCVGVDQWGMHVRAKFGVVRVGFETEARDAAAAERVIEGMLAQV